MKILSFLAKLVFFIVATAMFLPAKVAYFDGADQKKWQPTQAIITKSELGVKMVEDIRAKHKNQAKYEVNPMRETYFWDLEYSYTFNNQKYVKQGVYVNLKSSSYNKQDYTNRVLNNPVESKITAYVNPKKPEQAYIDRRTEGGIESWYNITRFFFYVSILLFFIPLFKWVYRVLTESSNLKPVSDVVDDPKLAEEEKPKVKEKTAEPTVQRSKKFKDDTFIR